ncbi:TlpA family protein disulfide reductase [Seonamhaeicola marinus]|uniref:TlpA family protein disulfide reductase n=1 Tax=Seonamhaeicola marinus TaxID=1912246 RepID=A0A5D0IZT2_9FLAO|nr:TlpA disulfide reductase family protein [Seonamhaeicola marinus]TYA89194.1 TlpA family protein disulfide reductase [Seonamhaeicola marinus]
MRRIIILIIISLNVLSCSQSQNMNPQEEKDWAYFQANKSRLCETKEQCDYLDSSNLLEYSKLIDAVYTKRSKMAEDFMDKYPESEHYDEMLNWFLHLYFEPKFISKDMDADRVAFLSSFTGPVRYGPKVTDFYRALPVDDKAMDKWVEKGNALVERVLNSDASDERKAEVEVRLLGRDFNLAKRWYDALPKMDREDDYWAHFDKQYWGSIYLRLFELLEKYPDYEPLAEYILSLLEEPLKIRSPKLAESYTKSFIEMSSNQKMLASGDAVKLLNEKLMSQKKAREALTEEEVSVSIEMDLVGLDGTEVKLSQLRGKLVLVDFWSIRCAPCIREMPHVASLYEKYKDEGFEVVGIVAEGDEAKERVLEITDKQCASWLQHMDKGNKSKISYHNLYNINALPEVWLLDRNGQIVDKKARGKRLDSLLKEYLRK